MRARIAFTSSGVRVGRCESSSATPPETIAAACEVPEPRTKRAAGPKNGEFHFCPAAIADWHAAVISSSANEPATCKLMTCMPGATTSGCRVESFVVKSAVLSSDGSFGVPMLSNAPTAMIRGSYAGAGSVL